MTNNFPVESALYPNSSQYQYSDSFAIPLQRTDIESWELIAAFFQSAPSWVDGLFVFRNRIVEHLGLKTGRYNSRDFDPPYLVGQRIGLFRVIDLTDREIIMGEDDTHLDFRTSLLLIPTHTGSQLVVSTLVKTKNTLGGHLFFSRKAFSSTHRSNHGEGYGYENRRKITSTTSVIAQPIIPLDVAR